MLLMLLKKIGTAFTVLSDKEKREFYDKYGTEEEYREKYHQAHQNQQNEEDLDPFDLFNMFFNGNMNAFNERRFMRRRQQEGQNGEPVRINRFQFLIQLLPLILIGLSSFWPYIFNSTSYYSFTPTEIHYVHKKTHINDISFYVGDKYLSAYKKENDIEDYNVQIENEYLEFLNNQCNYVNKYKNDLEYKLYYYRNSIYENLIQNEISRLDFSVCDKYNEFKKILNS